MTNRSNRSHVAAKVNRRIFLRGLGGAVVAAPFLSSLSDRSLKAQSTSTDTAPKRLIVMFTQYGCLTTRFFPKKSHGKLTAADLESTTLKHLTPYVDKLLMPRGIRAMNEWTTTLKRGQGNDSYLQAVGSYFTCQPVTPNGDDPFSFDQATKFNAKPKGPSLDHVIAQQLSPGGSPLFMRVGNLNEGPPNAISYSAAETQFPGLGQATQVFSTLTGLFQADAPVSADSYEVARGQSVLDIVSDDLATLERANMSQADRLKLEAWKELLHQTGSVVASAQCNEDVAAALGATQANVDGVATRLGSDPLTSKVNNGTLDGADVYSSLAALAAVCNSNPVIFLKYPGSYIFSGLGVMTESTSLSHRLDNANSTGICLPNALELIHTIDDFYARKFAYLLQMLDSVTEGEGTVLDNTATVWFQEVSDGCARNLNNLPIVQAGSAGGYFKTGWTVNVDDGAADLTQGDSESSCAEGTTNMVNALDQSTGTPAHLANAPINKYYCNLMNALGVKAGSDGFPAVGGQAEVTRFGMYDTTEDFIHGGTLPPRIVDPGEFTELKAGS